MPETHGGFVDSKSICQPSDVAGCREYLLNNAILRFSILILLFVKLSIVQSIITSSATRRLPNDTDVGHSSTIDFSSEFGNDVLKY